jgi:hypothetical protein
MLSLCLYIIDVYEWMCIYIYVESAMIMGRPEANAKPMFVYN